MTQLKLGLYGIESTLQDFQECFGPGWSEIIRQLVVDLTELGWDGIALQIKEKFGGLRIYLGEYATEEMLKLVYLAEAESLEICEECGQQGRLASLGWWLKTLCEAHAIEAVQRIKYEY